MGVFLAAVFFSAFWLRSSVVSVLISLISGIQVIDLYYVVDINLIFGIGELSQLTGGFRALAMDLHPSMAEASNHKPKSHAKSPLSAVHKLYPNHVKAMPKPT